MPLITQAIAGDFITLAGKLNIACAGCWKRQGAMHLPHTSQSVGCVGGAKFWYLMMRDVRLKMFELPHFTWGIEIMNEGALFFGQR